MSSEKKKAERLLEALRETESAAEKIKQTEFPRRRILLYELNQSILCLMQALGLK